MKKGILLVGEPMALLIARQEGALEAVEDYHLAVAGAEYNVAVGMRRLGHSVGYVTKLGRDPFGRRIVRGMEQNEINTGGVYWSEQQRTGFMLKSRVSRGDPEVFYFRNGSAASTLCPEDVDAIDLSQYSNLHMTGILPALSGSCQAAAKRLLERAREAGLFISFDPNLRPVLWESRDKMAHTINELAALAHLVLPGINEGEILTGSREPQKIADFYRRNGTDAVVVKQGSAGAFASDAAGSFTVPGYAVKTVVDTVGAGDGFAVGVISGLMEGLPLRESVLRGNAIGAMQVMSEGDNEGLPERGQLTCFMADGNKGEQ